MSRTRSRETRELPPEPRRARYASIVPSVAIEPRLLKADGDATPIFWYPGIPMDEAFLRAAGVIPIEAIGQNFLVDHKLVTLVVSQIIPNAKVVELAYALNTTN